MSASRTARESGLVGCEVCGMVSRLPAGDTGHLHCRRCASPLHSRRPQALQRTTALVIAGLLLYIPANVYPVMTIELLGRPDPNTIMSGVRELFASGMWEIGLLVFCASIAVPLLKLLGLSYLLVWVYRGRGKTGKASSALRERTRLYRIIETIGRWSMLDMFLLSMLVALVRFGAIASIVPGLGATSFALVVVLTMFAAASFDPRLLWDEVEESDVGSRHA